MGITELTKEKVLAAANAQREILGLPALADLSETCLSRTGWRRQGLHNLSRIPKAQAVADIQAARQALAEIASAPPIRVLPK